MQELDVYKLMRGGIERFRKELNCSGNGIFYSDLQIICSKEHIIKEDLDKCLNNLIEVNAIKLDDRVSNKPIYRLICPAEEAYKRIEKLREDYCPVNLEQTVSSAA